MKFIVILGCIMFCLVVPAVKSEIVLKDLNSNEKFTQYSQVAVYMVKRFISPVTNTLVIAEKYSRETNSYNTLLTNILQGLDEQLAIQLFLGYYNDRLWDYNLFIVDSWRSFEYN